MNYNTKSAVQDKSIALISPGDRTDKIAVPLDAVNADYEVNPDSIRQFDVVVADTPDRGMLYSLLKAKLYGTPVLFRMRGDPFWGLDEWVDSKIKRWIANDIMLGQVDGCIAIGEHQAEKYEANTGVDTRLVALPKQENNWLNHIHTENKLKIVTLTNAVYWPKVKPLLEIADVVNSLLKDVGGYWRIGSWSEGYSNRLKSGLEDYSHIEYHQPLNAKKALTKANAMIHYSNFDVALPNAILEGMASNLPVITNDYIAFTKSDAPTITTKNNEELQSTLYELADPSVRKSQGEAGNQYVKDNHTPKTIGRDFLDAIQELAFEQ